MDHGLEVLSEERCWELMADKDLGRLAVSVQGRPDIFPVNYLVHEGTVLVKTSAGLKLAAATLGVGVAFEVDAIDEINHSGWSIIVRGVATELEKLEELLEAEDLPLEPWAGGEKNRYIRITPDHVSGRQLPAG